MRKFLILVFINIFASDAFSAYQMESIIHTQEMTNSSEEELDQYSDIESETLEDSISSSSNIDEILKASPAASTARGPRSSSESPQVRGLDDNKIYVKVDGVREAFQDGHSSFIALDTENLKAVKVNRSSSKVSETGSIGGGVEFITKSVRDILKKGKKTGSEFSYKTSSVNEENSYNAKVLSRSKSFSNYLSLSSAKAHDSRLSNGELLDNSSYEDFSGLYKADFFNKYSLKLEYFKREDDAPTDPSLNPPARFEDLQSDNKTEKASVSIGYNHESLKFQSYFTTYIQEKIDRESKEVTTKKIETSSFKFDKTLSSIRFGSEFYKDKLHGEKKASYSSSKKLVTPGYPNAQADNFMSYIDSDIKLDQNLSLNLGARFDTYNLEAEDKDFSSKKTARVSKSFGLEAQLIEKTNIFFNFSEGFNAPSLNEVFASGLHIPGDNFYFRDNEFIANPNLISETSETKEIGLKSEFLIGGSNLLELGLSFYENDIKDYITREQIDRSIFDEQNGTTQFINLDRVKLYGAEARVSFIQDSLKLNFTYSKVRGKDTKSGNFIEDLPADNYRISSKYYLDRYRMNFGHELTYTEEQNRTNPNTLQKTDNTPDYLVHNLFVQKSIDDFRFDFRINNLTNIKYRKHASFLYETKRDFKLGFKYKINTF